MEGASALEGESEGHAEVLVKRPARSPSLSPLRAPRESAHVLIQNIAPSLVLPRQKTLFVKGFPRTFTEDVRLTLLPRMGNSRYEDLSPAGFANPCGVSGQRELPPAQPCMAREAELRLCLRSELLVECE